MGRELPRRRRQHARHPGLLEPDVGWRQHHENHRHRRPLRRRQPQWRPQQAHQDPPLQRGDNQRGQGGGEARIPLQRGRRLRISVLRPLRHRGTERHAQHGGAAGRIHHTHHTVRGIDAGRLHLPRAAGRQRAAVRLGRCQPSGGVAGTGGSRGAHRIQHHGEGHRRP